MAHIDDLIASMRELEEQVEAEYAKKQSDFAFIIEARRVRFSEEVETLQRGTKVGLWRYVTQASIFSWLAAPVISYAFAPTTSVT